MVEISLRKVQWELQPLQHNNLHMGMQTTVLVYTIWHGLGVINLILRSDQWIAGWLCRVKSKVFWKVKMLFEAVFLPKVRKLNISEACFWSRDEAWDVMAFDCALQGSRGQECGSSGQDHHDQMHPLHPLYQVSLALSFLSTPHVGKFFQWRILVLGWLQSFSLGRILLSLVWDFLISFL